MIKGTVTVVCDLCHAHKTTEVEDFTKVGPGSLLPPEWGTLDIGIPSEKVIPSQEAETMLNTALDMAPPAYGNMLSDYMRSIAPPLQMSFTLCADCLGGENTFGDKLHAVMQTERKLRTERVMKEALEHLPPGLHLVSPSEEAEPGDAGFAVGPDDFPGSDFP